MSDNNENKPTKKTAIEQQYETPGQQNIPEELDNKHNEDVVKDELPTTDEKNEDVVRDKNEPTADVKEENSEAGAVRNDSAQAVNETVKSKKPELKDEKQNTEKNEQTVRKSSSSSEASKLEPKSKMSNTKNKQSQQDYVQGGRQTPYNQMRYGALAQSQFDEQNYGSRKNHRSVGRSSESTPHKKIHFYRDDESDEGDSTVSEERYDGYETREYYNNERYNSRRTKEYHVDPKKVAAIEKRIPVCTRNNLLQFTEALEDQAYACDWPTYILDLQARAWDHDRDTISESNRNKVLRKEAYLVISHKIHKDLKDYVKDDDKRGDAQNIYRRLRQVIHLSNEEYAIELEAQLTNIFRKGCKEKNILQYGVAIKNKNDELKAIDKGFDEKKLVLLYKKGLPYKVEVVSVKLDKPKYNTLAKARELIETFVRNSGYDELTYNDFKYKTNEEKQAYKDKREKSRKEKKKSEEQSNNMNTKELECKYYKSGKCKAGKTCKYLHTNKQNNYEHKGNNNNKSLKHLPCYKFPDCKFGDKCKFSHDKKLCDDHKKKNNEEKKHNEEYTGSFEVIDLTNEPIQINLTLTDDEEKILFEKINEKNKERKRRKKRRTRKKRTYANLMTEKETPKVGTPKKFPKNFREGHQKPCVWEDLHARDVKVKTEKEHEVREDLVTKMNLNIGTKSNELTVDMSMSERIQTTPVSKRVSMNTHTNDTQVKEEYVDINMITEVTCTQSTTQHTTMSGTKTILDSGAMSHSVMHLNVLEQKTVEIIKNLRVIGVSGVCQNITHKGQWLLSKDAPGVQQNIRLHNVIVIPSSGSNIISIPKLSEAGYDTNFTNNEAFVYKNEVLIMKATLENRLFVVSNELTINNSTVKNNNLINTHERLGHIHFDFCRTYLGLEPASEDFPNPKCESCDMAKLPELRREKEATREANKRGYSLHIDISPKHPPSTEKGFTRVVEFVDEHTKYFMIEPCKAKSEATGIIKNKVVETENLVSPTKVGRIRNDGARELVHKKELLRWYKERGIKLQHSAPYHQYQNGLVERSVRTINEGARAMMLRANSPAGDWLLAKQNFVYLRNHFYTPKGMTDTPAKLWFGIDSATLPEGIFGCKCIAKLYVRKKSGNPAEETKGRMCVYLGMDEVCKAYKVRPYDGKKTTRQIRYSKRVSFYVNEFPYTHPDVPRPNETDIVDSDDDLSEPELIDPDDVSDDELELDLDNDSPNLNDELDEKHTDSESEDDDPTTQWRVNELLNKKTENGITYYRVRWEGAWKDTWEPETNLSSKSINDYHKKHNKTTYKDLHLNTDTDTDTDTDTESIHPSEKTGLEEDEKNENREDTPPRRSQRLRQSTLTICNNTEAKVNENDMLSAKNLFKSDRQELDELYDRVGREIDPKTHKQQERSPYKKFWDEAFLKEFMALKTLGVLELTRRNTIPKGMPVLRPVVVRKTKYRQHEDKIDKHKVRICADGSTQIVDHVKTFAPTVVYHSVLIVLMIACHYDLDIESLDIKNFYVRCDMGDEEVYLEQVPGWEEAPRQDFVYRLRKAMYGTKSASKKAQKMLTSMMIEAKFSPLKSDPMIFACIVHKPQYKIAVVCAWSDDLLCVGNKELLHRMRTVLHKHDFQTEKTEEPKSYTGIQIDRDRKIRRMKVHQTQYTNELIQRLKIVSTNKVRSPMLAYSVDEQVRDMTERRNSTADKQTTTMYQQQCGGLMWLTKTRPDIAFALSVACRGMSNPIRSDLRRIKRILEYVAGSQDIGIIWQVQGPFETISSNPTIFDKISAVADSDLAGRVENSRSTSGYYIQFDKTGMMFGVSQLQKVVSVSTTHSELVCACECAKTVEWVKGFLEELELKTTKPIQIQQDNQPAIALSNNPMYHFRTRHFRIAQHYLRDLVDRGVVEMIYTPTNDMNADYLNKTQSPQRHLEIRMRCQNN